MEKDVPDFILNNDELYSEQVLLDYDGAPILFICKGKNSGKRYVSVCTDSNELKYVIVECETKIIIEMILGKIELSKCLRSNNFYYEVVAGSNCELDKVEKKNIEELDKLNKDMSDKDFKFDYKFTYNAKKIEDYLDNLRYVNRGFVVFNVDFSKILELEDDVCVSVRLGFMNDDVAYIAFDREKCDYILKKYEKPIISYIEEIIDIFNSIIIGSRKKVNTASFNRGEKKIFIYRDDRTFYIFDSSYYHIIMELFRNLSDIYHRYNADEAIDTIFNKKYKDLLNNLLNYIDEDKYLKIEGDVEYTFHKYSINRSLKTYNFDARHILGIKKSYNKNINARIAINTKFVDIDEFGIYIKSSDNPIYDRILNNRIIYNIFKTSIFNKDDIVKMSDNYWRVKSYISFDVLTRLIHSSIYDVRGVDIWNDHKNGGIQWTL